MAKNNPVVHFEFPGEDLERMKKFYGEAFGWDFTQMGPEMGNYVVVMTSESDKNGPLEKGKINGGFYKKSADPISQYPSVVIAVEDINKSIEDVKAAGGQVLGGSKKDGQPEMIPGVGMFASILDSEGNRVSIMQPLMPQQ
ncbi:VOC family protein [Candidatus Parcubacteria bacterium]|nr:VOC family protein [Candidatus Parcubacteria bacterium]